MALDAFVLFMVGILYGAYKSKHNINPQEKKKIDMTDKFWIFGKYYALAILLAFNANVAFSSFLMLLNASGTTTISIINVLFAGIVLAFSVAFFVGFFIWTRQLSVPIIYPEPK